MRGESWQRCERTISLIFFFSISHRKGPSHALPSNFAPLPSFLLREALSFVSRGAVSVRLCLSIDPLSHPR